MLSHVLDTGRYLYFNEFFRDDKFKFVQMSVHISNTQVSYTFSHGSSKNRNTIYFILLSMSLLYGFGSHPYKIVLCYHIDAEHLS